MLAFDTGHTLCFEHMVVVTYQCQIIDSTQPVFYCNMFDQSRINMYNMYIRVIGRNCLH